VNFKERIGRKGIGHTEQNNEQNNEAFILPLTNPFPKIKDVIQSIPTILLHATFYDIQTSKSTTQATDGPIIHHPSSKSQPLNPPRNITHKKAQ
jgi:hypothetical protein